MLYRQNEALLIEQAPQQSNYHAPKIFLVSDIVVIFKFEWDMQVHQKEGLGQ